MRPATASRSNPSPTACPRICISRKLHSVDEKNFQRFYACTRPHALGQKVVVGLGKSTNDEYGVELATRGYVVLATPYPLLANYHPDLKALGYPSGTMREIAYQLFDEKLR